MNRKAALQLSISFIVIIIICIVVFSFSIYTIRRFFTQAEIIKMTYDERTEKEIERLLDDGSRIAIPFDKKTISNGEFKTFGIGILNILNKGYFNDFRINITFNKAFDKRNNELCDTAKGNTPDCGNPSTWLQTTAGLGDDSGVIIEKTIKNNEQEKFLLGVNVKGAPSGTYIFDLDVSYNNDTHWIQYDYLHKLYVDVP